MKPEVKIVGVEPTEGHTIQGLKNMTESMVPKIYAPALLDEKMIVEDALIRLKRAGIEATAESMLRELGVASNKSPYDIVKIIEESTK